jgi:ATP-binding cassette, subfamily B, bacterial
VDLPSLLTQRATAVLLTQPLYPEWIVAVSPPAAPDQPSPQKGPVDGGAAPLPEQIRRSIEPGERIGTWAWTDVDRNRQFRGQWMVLTDRRLLVVPEDRSGANGSDGGDALTVRVTAGVAGAVVSPQPQREIRSWPIDDVAELRSSDRGGLGTLEIVGASQLLDRCHYTLGLGPAVLVLVEQFAMVKHGSSTVVSTTASAEVDRPEPESAEPPPNSKALLRLLSFARPHRLAIAMAFLLSLLATVGAIAPRKLSGPLIDGLTQYQALGGPFPPVGWYLAGMCLAFASAWLLGWAQGAILAVVSEKMTADLRQKAFAHLQKLSLEYFGGKRTGDLMTRLSGDADRLVQFLSDSVVDFVADCLLLVGIAVSLFWSEPTLATAALAPFPFVLWVMYRSRDALQTGFTASGKALSAMTSVLADTIPGIRVVKAFAQEQREIERFDAASQQLMQANNRVNAVWTFFWPLISFLNNLGVLVVWAAGVWLVSRQQLTVGTLTEFVLLSQLFYSRLESMSRMVNASQRAGASAQRIFEILDRVSSVPEPAQPVPLMRLRGELEFRHVGFRYGNRRVIQELNLSIAPGEMIGLVGHTGAGKSTLINLVCRFFDVAEGAILADGCDVRSYRIADYRRNIGIVLQDPFLFYGTIAENISYGKPQATQAEIIAAAKAARAHEFILQLPDGYDSLVGERGQSLSGGERQRISIARALLIDPRILILDEATSAIDTQTEREIQEALHTLVQGRTTIAIAHRLSTLRQAHRIVVLERGRIVEIGTHDELLVRNGVYAGLHRAQQELTKDIGW